MQKQITHDIEIRVVPVYQEHYSNPVASKYIFAYFITIVNHGTDTVQLLRRHWFIYEPVSGMREVAGEGVVGQKPILHPGESFEYDSWTDMPNTIGKMYGYFTMKRLTENDFIKVEIPVFPLVVPYKLN